MTHDLTNFIVIDDDPVNNKICTIIIGRIYPEKKVTSFTDPELGLSYIQQNYPDTSLGDVILLLDINMPVLTGWDVLERFEKMPENIRSLFQIYILSSSVDSYDKKKAESCDLVSGYIEKPLTIERVKQFFGDS